MAPSPSKRRASEGVRHDQDDVTSDSRRGIVHYDFTPSKPRRGRGLSLGSEAVTKWYMPDPNTPLTVAPSTRKQRRSNVHQAALDTTFEEREESPPSNDSHNDTNLSGFLGENGVLSPGLPNDSSEEEEEDLLNKTSNSDPTDYSMSTYVQQTGSKQVFQLAHQQQDQAELSTGFVTKLASDTPQEIPVNEEDGAENMEVLTQYSAVKQSKSSHNESEREPLQNLHENHEKPNSAENESDRSNEVLTQYSAAKQTNSDDSDAAAGSETTLVVYETAPVNEASNISIMASPVINGTAQGNGSDASAGTPGIYKTARANTPNTLTPSASSAFLQGPSPSMRSRVNASPVSALKLAAKLREKRLKRNKKQKASFERDSKASLQERRASLEVALAASRRSSFGAPVSSNNRRATIAEVNVSTILPQLPPDEKSMEQDSPNRTNVSVSPLEESTSVAHSNRRSSIGGISTFLDEAEQALSPTDKSVAFSNRRSSIGGVSTILAILEQPLSSPTDESSESEKTPTPQASEYTGIHSIATENSTSNSANDTKPTDESIESEKTPTQSRTPSSKHTGTHSGATENSRDSSHSVNDTTRDSSSSRLSDGTEGLLQDLFDDMDVSINKNESNSDSMEQGSPNIASPSKSTTDTPASPLEQSLSSPTDESTESEKTPTPQASEHTDIHSSATENSISHSANDTKPTDESIESEKTPTQSSTPSSKHTGTHSGATENSRDSSQSVNDTTRDSSSSRISDGTEGLLQDLFDDMDVGVNKNESNSDSMEQGSPNIASPSKSTMDTPVSPPSSSAKRASMIPNNYSPKQLTPSKLAGRSPRRVVNPASIESPARNTRRAQRLRAEEESSRESSSAESPPPASPPVNTTSPPRSTPTRLTPTKLAGRSPRRITNPNSIDSPARNTRSAKASMSPIFSPARSTRSSRKRSLESVAEMPGASSDGSSTSGSSSAAENTETVNPATLNDLFADVPLVPQNKRESLSTADSDMRNDVVNSLGAEMAEEDRNSSDSPPHDSTEDVSVAPRSNARKPAKRPRSVLFTSSQSEDDTMSSNMSDLTTADFRSVPDTHARAGPILNSALKKRSSTTDIGGSVVKRNVAFGSPEVAEYDKGSSPSRRMTPMPKGSVKKWLNRKRESDELSPDSSESSNASPVEDKTVQGDFLENFDSTSSQADNEEEAGNSLGASVETRPAEADYSLEEMKRDLNVHLKNVTDCTLTPQRSETKAPALTVASLNKSATSEDNITELEQTAGALFDNVSDSSPADTERKETGIGMNDSLEKRFGGPTDEKDGPEGNVATVDQHSVMEASLASTSDSTSINGGETTVHLEPELGPLVSDAPNMPTAEPAQSNSSNETDNNVTSPADSVEMTDAASLRSMNDHANKHEEDDNTGPAGQKLNFDITGDISHETSLADALHQRHSPSSSDAAELLDSTNMTNNTSNSTSFEGDEVTHQEDQSAELESGLETLLEEIVSNGRDSIPSGDMNSSLEQKLMDNSAFEQESQKSNTTGDHGLSHDDSIGSEASEEEDQPVQIEPNLGLLARENFFNDALSPKSPLEDAETFGKSPLLFEELDNTGILSSGSSPAFHDAGFQSKNRQSKSPSNLSRQSFSIGPESKLSLSTDGNGSILVDTSFAGDDDSHLREDLVVSRQEASETMMSRVSPNLDRAEGDDERIAIDITCAEINSFVSMNNSAFEDRSLFSQLKDVRFGRPAIAAVVQDLLHDVCKEVDRNTQSVRDETEVLQDVIEQYPDEMLVLQKALRSSKPERDVAKKQLCWLSDAAQASAKMQFNDWEADILDIACGKIAESAIETLDSEEQELQRKAALLKNTMDQLSGAAVRKARRQSINHRKAAAAKLEEEIGDLQAQIDESKATLEAMKQKTALVDREKDALVARNKATELEKETRKAVDSTRFKYKILNSLIGLKVVSVTEEELVVAFPCFSCRTGAVVSFDLTERQDTIRFKVKIDSQLYLEWDRVKTRRKHKKANHASATAAFSLASLKHLVEYVKQTVLHTFDDVRKLCQHLEWRIGRIEMTADELESLRRRHGAVLKNAASHPKASFLASVEFQNGQNGTKLKASFELAESYPFTPLPTMLETVHGSVDVDSLRRQLIKNAKPGFFYLSRTIDVIAAFVS